jgi:urease beta subunit
MAPALPQSAGSRFGLRLAATVYCLRGGRAAFPALEPEAQEAGMIPGEYLLGDGDIEANVGRRTVQLTVANTGDRPIQVGSHFHFFEANRALRFQRGRTFGMRLNVPAGTAVRFEPGDEKVVTLVELAGAREVYGLNALTEGSTAESRRAGSLARAAEGGFEGSRP